jgi:hypothetical protein
MSDFARWVGPGSLKTFGIFRIKQNGAKIAASRSKCGGSHTLEESSPKTNVSEVARVYNNKKTLPILARNTIVHNVIPKLDECLKKIVQKSTRLPVSSLWPGKNTLPKKC